jgi:DNA mismatch repair protein PMS2
VALQIQKVFNEVYRSFNANQSPFVVANFVIPLGTLLVIPINSWVSLAFNIPRCL